MRTFLDRSDERPQRRDLTRVRTGENLEIRQTSTINWACDC